MRTILSLLMLVGCAQARATENDIIADIIQISTGGPLIDPASPGVLNLRTKESDVTFESASDAYSIYAQTGAVTVEGGVSGMIRAVTGPVADEVTNGYTGNLELWTSSGKGTGYSGDVVLGAAQHQDTTDNGGRVILYGIRSIIGSGYLQLFKSDGVPSGATPEEGDMYYDTSAHAPRVYDGTEWKTLQLQ